MTDKTLRVWQYLDETWSRHDPMPTVREVVAALGLSSTSVARYHMELLERAGVIRWEPMKARAIWVLKPYRGGDVWTHLQ